MAAAMRWLLCLLLCSAAWADDFTVGPVALKPVGPASVEVRIGVSQPAALKLAPTVPLTWAPIRMRHDLRLKGLLEDSLLDSFYEEDLNDDGNYDELFVHKMDDGRVRIDQMPMEPLKTGPGAPETPYKADGSGDPRIYRLGPSANDIAVEYYVPPLMSIFLRHLYHLIHVREFPNPVLVVTVFEPCQGPTDKWSVPQDPSFKVMLPNPPQDPEAEPKLRVLHSWEPWPLDPRKGHTWIRGWWVALPIASAKEVVFQIAAGSNAPIGLSASVSYSLTPGTRLYTPPVIKPVWFQ